ncbi:Uncharacterised protein [Vibrio cholerae]|nr:Uncharacterised protein [Vibrio cholerae]CSC70403.1 Uncharacterised protein [Vibrio cholerae]
MNHPLRRCLARRGHFLPQKSVFGNAHTTQKAHNVNLVDQSAIPNRTQEDTGLSGWFQTKRWFRPLVLALQRQCWSCSS